MIDPNHPAFPSSDVDGDSSNTGWVGGGLTIRAHFASMAMQGLLAAGDYSDDCKGQLAIGAVAIADALIERLSQ